MTQLIEVAKDTWVDPEFVIGISARDVNKVVLIFAGGNSLSFATRRNRAYEVVESLVTEFNDINLERETGYGAHRRDVPPVGLGGEGDVDGEGPEEDEEGGPDQGVL